jgi:hypothetical protein
VGLLLLGGVITLLGVRSTRGRPRHGN